MSRIVHARRSIAAILLIVLTTLGRAALCAPPFNDPADTHVWPNKTSFANSDPWIVANHDGIRRMRPRLLVINLSNQTTMEQVKRQTEQLIAALAESSRYHGYQDTSAPVFLQYQVFKYVDLRDPGATKGNSSRSPYKKDAGPKDMNCDYGAFFNDTFAGYFGVRDPKNPGRYYRLDELVNAGYVHEVWFFAAATGDLRCLECIELKPAYDERFRRKPGDIREAGNGGDPDRKWTGRSLRINNLNPDRGIGCAMENLGHCLEGMANADVIPYYTKYFREYAGLDLDARYKFPFSSFYALDYGKKVIDYPDDKTAVVTYQGKDYRLENYHVNGGNVHFPPNGRMDYDLVSDRPVSCCIEEWRTGPKGESSYRDFTIAAFAPYRAVAPDCMGAWVVYWRQNMPGLNNRQKDDVGKPMKNWWPFLFY